MKDVHKDAVTAKAAHRVAAMARAVHRAAVMAKAAAMVREEATTVTETLTESAETAAKVVAMALAVHVQKDTATAKDVHVPKVAVITTASIGTTTVSPIAAEDLQETTGIRWDASQLLRSRSPHRRHRRKESAECCHASLSSAICSTPITIT